MRRFRSEDLEMQSHWDEQIVAEDPRFVDQRGGLWFPVRLRCGAWIAAKPDEIVTMFSFTGTRFPGETWPV